MEEVYRSLEEVISCIKNSVEYQKCITLKDKMNDNEEVKDFILKLKKTQQKYVKSNYSDSIKQELDSYEKQLEEIPIYQIYLQNLEIVNEKIEYVKDCLNDYFYQLFNEKYTD